MGKKTTIKIKDLQEILEKIPKIKMEEKYESWGCVTPHYKDVVTVDSIMFYVKKHLNLK